jgi:hypothetical protein
MRPQDKAPDLAEAIAAHAGAVLAHDTSVAERYVTPAALETYRLAMNEGQWLIAEAEYFPPGRTPWTGVRPPRPAAWQTPTPGACNK